MQILPCCYYARIQYLCPSKIIKIVARPASYLDAPVDDFTTHHLLLDDCGSYFAIQGPYYRSLLSAFHITVGDTIKFSWDEDKDIYNVSVLSGIDELKYWFGFPGNFI
jgi:hypothetical protein